MRPHLLVYCAGHSSDAPHKPTPLGRLIDCRGVPASSDDVVPPDEWADWNELSEQLTGERLLGAPVRAGRLINWQPVVYVADTGVELSRVNLASKRSKAGDLWTIRCPRCKRSPEVSDVALCTIFDTFVANWWRDDAGRPIVALSVLEEAVRAGW